MVKKQAFYWLKFSCGQSAANSDRSESGTQSDGSSAGADSAKLPKGSAQSGRKTEADLGIRGATIRLRAEIPDGQDIVSFNLLGPKGIGIGFYTETSTATARRWDDPKKAGDFQTDADFLKWKGNDVAVLTAIDIDGP
jgi:hypothetical protein